MRAGHCSGAGPATKRHPPSCAPTPRNWSISDRINARETRLSVGAVNVRTGNFAYFDNAQHKIGPEHVMASAALPPAFPAVEIDGEYYWTAAWSRTRRWTGC